MEAKGQNGGKEASELSTCFHGTGFLETQPPLLVILKKSPGKTGLLVSSILDAINRPKLLRERERNSIIVLEAPGAYGALEYYLWET
jgi:hypothetical protein